MSNCERSFCSTFHRAIELIGRRWAGAILHVLAQGPTRFAAIRATVPDISPRILTERLRELEEAGIVERTVLPERPPGVEYSLTDSGTQLHHALEPLGGWAHRWLPVEERSTEDAHDSSGTKG